MNAASPVHEQSAKLPLWRLTAAILVLAGMAAVLLALAPVYLEDYRLRQYVKSLVREPAAVRMPDETLRANLLNRAHALDLPVRGSDVEITHPDGKLRVQLKYAVQMDFPLYQVDLHFHPGATSQ